MSRDERPAIIRGRQTKASLYLITFTLISHRRSPVQEKTTTTTFRLSLNIYTKASETRKYSVNLSLQKTVKYLDATVKGLVHDSTEKRREKCSQQKLGTG